VPWLTISQLSMELNRAHVISPILYCVYVDDLLLILSKAGVSCLSVYTLWVHLHTRMTSFFCYLPLLRCTNFSLYVKIMPANIAMHLNPIVWLPYLRIVTTLPKKSMIVFVYIDGSMIDLVQSFSHLGQLITSDSDDGEDITTRKHSFIGQVNNTLWYFGKISSFVIYTVLVIMDVSDGRYQIVMFKEFCIAWRKSLRRLWGLPFQTPGVL